MDTQKLAESSSGDGVYNCQKCGWPYPKHHPNSKRRRAHRKVCGTIHGYKLAVDFEGSAHSNLSDDDPKNPCVEDPKPVEVSGDGELLTKKSEDEVFSDAVTEFTETADKTRGNLEDAVECATTDRIGAESRSIQTIAPEFPGHSAKDASLEAVACNSLDVKTLPTEVSDEENSVFRSKMSEAESAQQAVTDISDDPIEKMGEVEPSVHLITMADAIHEVDDPTIMLEDSKDHNALNSNPSATSEDRGDEVKDEKQGTDEVGGVANKDIVTQMDKVASDSCATGETHLIGDGDDEKIVNSGDYDGQGASEKCVIVPEMTIGSSEKLDMDLNGEEEAPCDVIKKVNTEEFAGDASVDSETFSGVKITQETDLYDVGIHDKVGTEKEDINGDAKTRTVTESCSENAVVTREPVNKLTETETPRVYSSGEGVSSDLVEQSSQITAQDEFVNTVSDAQIGEEKEIRNDQETRSLNSVSNQGESGPKQLGGSVVDISADSLSQTDSLENNWGSVSVISIQSDAEARPEKPSIEERHAEKAELIEPPSFLTLVEPKNRNASEIQTSSVQAGWIPSINHVANESEGRKKNEEMIAKWSAGKQQHTPLKSLLGEATLEARAKSAVTVNSILAPESQVVGEWESPARYPTEIKREKRKPYWAHFMCCSSVH